MATLTLEILGATFKWTLEHTPSWLWEESPLLKLLYNEPLPTYRERLDRQYKNAYGRVLTTREVHDWKQCVYMGRCSR